MDTSDLLPTAVGKLTIFSILHVTASSEPGVPVGSPGGCPEVKYILSEEATVSKVTKSAERLFVGEPMWQLAAGKNCCDDAAKEKPSTVIDVMD